MTIKQKRATLGALFGFDIFGIFVFCFVGDQNQKAVLVTRKPEEPKYKNLKAVKSGALFIFGTAFPDQNQQTQKLFLGRFSFWCHFPDQNQKKPKAFWANLIFGTAFADQNKKSPKLFLAIFGFLVKSGTAFMGPRNIF